ncbi:hypothetical protein D9M70_504080 [compost metagenome]
MSLQSAQIVDQGKQHHPQDQTDADLHPPTLYPFRKRTTARPFDQVKQQMPPVQHGNRQEIQNPQANAQIGEEIEKIPHPGLG